MRIVATLIVALATLVVAFPASAGNSTPTGVRLGLLGGFTDRAILANTPFYVKQGFLVDDPNSGCNPCDSVSDVQQSQITLKVDGTKQNGTVIQEFSTTKPRTLIGKSYLFNFANGLPEGTYVFHMDFIIRGAVVNSRDVTVYSVASCENGTTNGLLCAGPPPPA